MIYFPISTIVFPSHPMSKFGFEVRYQLWQCKVNERLPFIEVLTLFQKFPDAKRYSRRQSIKWIFSLFSFVFTLGGKVLFSMARFVAFNYFASPVLVVCYPFSLGFINSVSVPFTRFIVCSRYAVSVNLIIAFHLTALTLIANARVRVSGIGMTVFTGQSCIVSNRPYFYSFLSRCW